MIIQDLQSPEIFDNITFNAKQNKGISYFVVRLYLSNLWRCHNTLSSKILYPLHELTGQN